MFLSRERRILTCHHSVGYLTCLIFMMLVLVLWISDFRSSYCFFGYSEFQIYNFWESLMPTGNSFSFRNCLIVRDASSRLQFDNSSSKSRNNIWCAICVGSWILLSGLVDFTFILFNHASWILANGPLDCWYSCNTLDIFTSFKSSSRLLWDFSFIIQLQNQGIIFGVAILHVNVSCLGGYSCTIVNILTSLTLQMGLM
jgi:hypothetical protein